MFNKVKKIFKKNIVLSIGLILCLGIMSIYAYTKFMPKWFSDKDMYNVVKEAFLTDKGYSKELSKHMSQEVFKSINIYNIYNVNSPDYKKPFKVEFNLNENSRFKVPGIVYVQMTYSVQILDSNNKSIGGSWNIPIKFTITNREGEWYITKKYENA